MAEGPENSPIRSTTILDQELSYKLEVNIAGACFSYIILRFSKLVVQNSCKRRYSMNRRVFSYARVKHERLTRRS